MPRLLFTSLLTALLLAPALASDGAPTALAESAEIDCYSDEAEEVCEAALTQASYWTDAELKTYSGKEYDEIRLKPTEDGFVPMIAGEGGMDFDHDIVAEVVFRNQDKLPSKMSGAKSVEYLGSGFDDKIGAEYTDAYFMLDLTLFYATFKQRMYKRKDGDTTVLWFEQLTPEMAGPDKWAAYEKRQQEIEEGLSLRWAFGSVLRLADIYGMFVVTKGSQQTTRITFVSKMEFGDDAGFIAQAGSQMRGVLRAGLKSGFVACVEIAKENQEKAKK
ncbi:MAG: hypothetical protein EP330_08165 [Deltaproteobacteria bacterium]|nr:MAG: hypothetical protein EP330_08165 [Deltaproteobacteria bacterium]